MRSAVEAAGDQSIPPPSSSLRWASHLPPSLPPHPPPMTSSIKSPSPILQETPEFHSERGSSGLEPGPSSTSQFDPAHKTPPRETDAPLEAAESARETPNDLFNEGDDSQPSTSRAHSDFVENADPMKFMKPPKLEPLDEESSRDGFTPLDSLTHIKTEAGLGRLSEMRSEDSRSEVSNVETKRYRVSFKVCSKAASRLKRILNSQPMALKRLGIAGVQVDSSGGMVSVAARAKERAVEEATRRPEPAHPGSAPTPSLPQPHIRGVPDRNGDTNGMMGPGVMVPQPGFPPQAGPPHGHPGMHPAHMAGPPGHINVQHPQMGDGPSGSGGPPMVSMPPSALPPHMQQQRQSQPSPTNSPILVNLLNSQQPPPSVGARPFSPYTGYPGGPPGPPVSGPALPPSAQPQSGPPMDMAAYHQMQQRMMIQQQQQQQHQQQQQQQQMQQQGVATPTTPGSGPGGYAYAQRPMFPAQQQAMFPPGHPNAQQRVPYPGQPALYGAMTQVKQEPITSGYGVMPQEAVDPAPPPAKKQRKKPTKKQQKEAEAAAASAQAAANQPGPYYPDGRMMHPQQMSGFPGGPPPHAQFPQGTGGPPPPGMPPQYYQQQQQQQNQQIAWQMQQQRMMQQQQAQQQQQQHIGMPPDYPPGTQTAPSAGPSGSWHPHQRPPPVPYPPGQHEGTSGGGGVSGVTGTGDMGSHSESNSPVTPFHPIMVQQQQPGHPSPMYSRESGSGAGTPTLFPYPSTSQGGPGPSGSSGQSGLNSTPLPPGTTPQTPGGQQAQSTLANDHHDFDDKLLGEGTLDDLNLGDLDDIVPMGDLAMMGTGSTDGGQARGDGRVKEEMEEENGEGVAGTAGSATNQIKRNGRHDLEMRETSITSIVDMVAGGGGELTSSTTPPSTATPTGGGNGGNGGSAFPATTSIPNTSSTAPPTPTLQTPPTPAVRRKITASSVQMTAHQRAMHQQRQSHLMMGPGGPQYAMPGPAHGVQGSMPTMHGHPQPHLQGHPMAHVPPQGHPHGHHLPHQPLPSNALAGHRMDPGRSLPPSYHQPARGRTVTSIENGRVNGHPELSNGNSSREESGTDATIQAILSKVKAQGIAQEQRAKEQRTNTGAKGRGGGTGARKKRKANEISKERSPKEEDDSFLFVDGLRGPPTMTAGQAAKARMGVGQGSGQIPPNNAAFYHQISSQNLPIRSQPPPLQHKPA